MCGLSQGALGQVGASWQWLPAPQTLISRPPSFSRVNKAMRSGNMANVMAGGQATVGNEPRKGYIPALAALILGVGAVGAAILMLPWQVILIAGVLAGAAGAFAMVRAGEAPVNRFVRLTGLGGLLLGGTPIVAGLFQAPTITTCGKMMDLSIATALESAVQNFRIEYGALPDVSRNIVATDSPDGLRLLKILLGMEDPTISHQNTRDIKFLSVPEGKNRRRGLIYTENGKSLEGLFDAYGNGYTVVLQVKSEEPLRLSFGKKVIELKGRDCAVFSPGKDGKPGTSDDVTTFGN